MAAVKNEFRQSQGVVPFGVGAIVDFPEESLMAAGLDVWPVEVCEPEERDELLAAHEILDGRLQDMLSAILQRRIERFLNPILAPGPSSFASLGGAPSGTGIMPFVRFPNWHFCPRCRLLTQVPWNAPSGDRRLRCDGKLRRLAGAARTCGELSPTRRPHLAPVRFAVACEHGHIMDFPWAEWVHQSTANCPASSGELFIVSTGGEGLAGVRIECSRCQAKRTLAGAFSQQGLRRIWEKCPGHRPWLGPDAAVPCDASPRAVQRGASNVYFPQLVNSILIPPYSERIRRLLAKPDIRDLIDGLVLEGDPGIPPPLLKLAQRHAMDPQVVIGEVRRLRQIRGDGAVHAGKVLSETEYRRAEYEAFLGPRPPRGERHDFDLSAPAMTDYPGWFGRFIERVALISKLRETRALLGFTRLVPPSVDNRSLASLSLKPTNWLPATETRGEGIFLMLHEGALIEWERANRALASRIARLRQRARTSFFARRGTTEEVGARYLLIHTLAHLLIRQLSFDCGYDSSSLRERLYVDSDASNPMKGLLVYTASGDSEGTLGGLVRQGAPGRFEHTLRAAVANAALCSSDPLCIESDGQGMESLNLAACHACALLPETSCERGNTLLDRGTVIGDLEHPGLGFLEGLTEASRIG